MMDSEARPLSTLSGVDIAAGQHPQRIVPPAPPPRDDALESPDVWGFRDSAFQVLPNGSVVMSGDRYPMCGDEMPDIIPWMERQIGLTLDPTDIHVEQYPPELPEPRRNEKFLEEVLEHLDGAALSFDPQVRLRHGHGHTQEEMYAIKYGTVGRIPDLVVYPSREEDVEALTEAALRHDVSLVPYGGGTNVTDALRCPDGEERMIVSVDLGRLNRILWIDPTNRMACIQAGAVGRDITDGLARYGMTMGHEPDSIEFSTLGGWIATNASGMKKNRYGNIEDLVLDVHMVTARGALSRTAVAPRESVGTDPRRWVFGSEGTLGIITRAVVRIFPLPEVQQYDAFLFPAFEQGVGFLFDVTRDGRIPASIRLMDNLQFQLGQTLKPRASGAKALKRRVERLYVTRLRGFDPDRMTACTLVYEGTKAEVETQIAAAKQIAGRYGGLRAGAANGERGYQLTFSIAYIRDFVMRHWILAESFETSVSWSDVITLCDNVKRRVAEEHRARGLPGRPFISARVTQVYPTGVCIYFYLAIYYKGVEYPSEVYAEIERAARDEILRSGGSLSHHHGVGKLREHFLPRIASPGTLAWRGALKHAVDPDDVFGIGNQRTDVPSSQADGDGPPRVPLDRDPRS
jgi:alkyldihydroxyacetonephosphate synthase